MRLWLFHKKMDSEYSWERHLVAGVTSWDAVHYMAILGDHSEEWINQNYEIEEIPLVGIVYSDIY